MPEVKILNNQRFREIGGVRRSLRAGKVVPMTDVEAANAVREGWGEKAGATAAAPKKRAAKKAAKKAAKRS